MQTVSARYINAVRGLGAPATWSVRGQVMEFGAAVVDGSGMPIIGGSYVCDRTAAIRGHISMTLGVDEAKWIPVDAGDLLFPVGREIAISAGFVYNDGTEEMMPLGVFRMSKPKTDDDGVLLVLTLDGYDRSRAVSRARFTQPYVIPAGTNYAEAIRALIRRAIPWIDDSEYVFMATPYVTPSLIFDVGDDPWNACMDMANALGAEVFFDMMGRPVLQLEPDSSVTDPSWDFVEGNDSNIVSVSRDLDDQDAYNGVVASGANASSGTAPVRAESWDTDPASPTYYDPGNPTASLYGPVPFFLESEFIISTQQAQVAADSMKRRLLGVLEAVTLEATPNPALDCGDVVYIFRQRAGVDITSVLDAYTLPFEIGGKMQLMTRKRRVS